MSDEDASYVLERVCERADIDSDEYDRVKAKAPSKEEAKELFNHASED